MHEFRHQTPNLLKIGKIFTVKHSVSVTGNCIGMWTNGQSAFKNYGFENTHVLPSNYCSTGNPKQYWQDKLLNCLSIVS